MLEVIQQPGNRFKAVKHFNRANVPMVALAAFIVVTNPAYACSAEVQPVFIEMVTWRYRLRQLPNDNFDHRPVVPDFLGSGDQSGWHILHFSNIWRCGNTNREICLWIESHREDKVGGSKAVGEPPCMLAISMFEARREAVGVVKAGSEPVLMVAPATAENVLKALGYR